MHTEDFCFLSSMQHTHSGLLRLTRCTGPASAALRLPLRAGELEHLRVIVINHTRRRSPRRLTIIFPTLPWLPIGPQDGGMVFRL
jgi:hypothetical protein